MALALLAVLWLLAVGGVVVAALHPSWLPALASAEGGYVDRQMALSIAILVGLFFLAHWLLGFLAWRGRARKPEAKYLSATDHVGMEMGWTLLTALIFLGLAWSGARSLAEVRAEQDKGASPLRIEVTGVQFAWYFHYSGADGMLGPTRAELVDASAGNAGAIGLDTRVASAQDDIVSQTLVLPVGREVELELRAQDVIHSFFVPELRFKQDAVPGRTNTLRFRLTRTGDYEIACAQLCGLGHYKMRASLRVVSEHEYEQWLRSHAPPAPTGGMP